MVVNETLTVKEYSSKDVLSLAEEKWTTHNLVSGFKVFRGEETVGRCAFYLCTDFYVSPWGKSASFGHWFCPDDEAASELFRAVEAKARTLNVRTLFGPFNGSSWDNYRWNADRDSRLFFTEENHAQNYVEQAFAAGFQIAATYSSHVHTLEQSPTAQYLKYRDKLEKTWSRRIRSLDLTRFESELDHVYDFVQKGFSRNFLASPISRSRFVEKYLPLQDYLDSKFLLVAEDENGSPVGLILAISDRLDSDGKTLVVKTIVRKEGAAYAGVVHALLERLRKISLENGIEQWIHAFMHDANASLAMSKKYPARIWRRYWLFSKSLM